MGEKLREVGDHGLAIGDAPAMYEQIPSAVAAIVEKTWSLVINPAVTQPAAQEQAVANYVDKLTRTMVRAMKDELGK